MNNVEVRFIQRAVVNCPYSRLLLKWLTVRIEKEYKIVLTVILSNFSSYPPNKCFLKSLYKLSFEALSFLTSIYSSSHLVPFLYIVRTPGETLAFWKPVLPPPHVLKTNIKPPKHHHFQESLLYIMLLCKSSVRLKLPGTSVFSFVRNVSFTE